MQKLNDRLTKQFTFKYSQPDEYHFCLDSIILAEYVAQNFKDLPPSARVLDLCSGCGVVGLELSYHLPQIECIDFVEIQHEFEKYFAENLKIAQRDSRKFRFLLRDLRQLDKQTKYDLIVCNPPYFFPENGKLGQSDFKNRCHFFIECNLDEVVAAVANSLEEKGCGFILVKEDLDSLLKFRATSPELSFDYAAEIRGTKLLSIKKP